MILEYNLQFFAKEGMCGERTEPATAKKKTDARKEGQVAKSKEIANGVGLIALFLILKIWIGIISEQMLELFSTYYSEIPELTTFLNGEISKNDMSTLVRTGIVNLIYIVLPFFLIGFIVVFIAEIVQVKWVISFKPLQPKFNKFNPISGLKKIFSPQSLVELVKSILKIILIIYVVNSVLKEKWMLIFRLYDMPLEEAIILIGEATIDLGLRISIIYLLISAGGYIYQRWKHNNDLKMSKQEIKEEFKNAEGDPQIKGKIRQKMLEVSRRRMMQELPKADVVITNPTHYAVALKYDTEVAPAPVVLAKGENYLAQKIKEVAKENKIEIVENKPLARMLYANVDVGEQIPEELYQAVAEILSVIYQMQNN